MSSIVKPTCRAIGFAVTLIAAAPQIALAQTAAPRTPAPAHPDREYRVPPQHFGRNGEPFNPNNPNESLGQSQGVMQPPSTGDQNVIPPQNQSRTPTPTIPPPGTPGGNPNIQPK